MECTNGLAAIQRNERAFGVRAPRLVGLRRAAQANVLIAVSAFAGRSYHIGTHRRSEPDQRNGEIRGATGVQHHHGAAFVGERVGNNGHLGQCVRGDTAHTSIMPVSTGVLYAANPVAGLTDSSGGSTADSIKPGVGKTVIPIFIDLPTLADGDVVTSVTPGFAGRIDVVEFYVHKAVTTASKASTLNLEIGTTNLTGGSVALTSANCTPAGAKISGSSITGNNTFTASQTISLEASSTTSFVEGSGWIVLSMTNADEENAFASIVSNQNQLLAGLRSSGLVVDESHSAPEERAEALSITIETTSQNQTFTLPLGNTGTYDAVVAWGDGTSDEITSFNDVDLAHTYGVSGQYRIDITGTLPWINFNNGGDKDLVKEVVFRDVGSLSMLGALYGCSNLSSINGVISSTVSSLNTCFFNCPSLPQIDLSSWPVGSVTDFTRVARACSSVTIFNASGCDVSSVTSFPGCIQACTSLSTLLISGWNPTSATNFQDFARQCTLLSSFPAGIFDSCPCTNFTDAFFNCALDQTSVDNILVSINAAGTSNGTLDIDGHTSSAPGAAGTAAISDLTGRGWVVTTN